MNFTSLEEVKKSHEAERDFYLKQENDSETEAVRQLILVAGGFLALSPLLITNNGGCTVLIFRVLLAISMAIGCSIFITDIKFFAKWRKAHEAMIKRIDEKDFSSVEIYDQDWKKEEAILPSATSTIWLVLQVTSLFAAILIFLTL